MDYGALLRVFGCLPDAVLEKNDNFDRYACMRKGVFAYLDLEEGWGVSEFALQAVETEYKVNNLLLNKSLFGMDFSEISDLAFYSKVLVQYFVHYQMGDLEVDFTDKESYLKAVEAFDDLRSSGKFAYVGVKTEEQIKDALISMVSGTVAYDKLQDVYSLARGYGVLDKSGNKDIDMLRIARCDKSFETGEEFFRSLLYHVTGSLNADQKTVFLRSLSDDAVHFIQETLKHDVRCAIASEGFRRHKSWYLRVKRWFNNQTLSSLFNRMNKLSRKHRKSGLVEYDIDKLRDGRIKLKDLTYERLTGLLLYLNKVRFESSTDWQSRRFYILKSGKFWGKEGCKPRGKDYDCEALIQEVETEIGSRLSGEELSEMYMPVYQRKRDLGGLVTDSLIRIPEKVNLGVGWLGKGIDLDLSGLTQSGDKIGWDADRKIGRGLSFSGDITSAPEGATEFISFDGRTRKDPFVLCLNDYNGRAVREGTEVLFFISEESGYDHIKTSRDLVVRARFKMMNRGYFLGAVIKLEGEWYFRVLNLACPGLHVSRGDMLHYGVPVDIVDRNVYTNYYIDNAA